MSEQPRRRFTVTRTRLDAVDPLPPFDPQEALRQVERLRQLEAELRRVPLGRLERRVQRRSLR